MAGELQAQHVSGVTLYAILVDSSGGVWNGATFDSTPTGGEWTGYDIALAEQGSSGYYVGDLPALASGRYAYRVHKQLGGSPASTDPVVWTGELDSRLANLDMPLSTVAGYVDTEVQAILTAQSALAVMIASLSDMSPAEAQAAAAAALAAYPVPLIADIEAAIAAGSGATPETFWNYIGPGGRTLTQSMIAILTSMIEGSTITITRGDTVPGITITGLGNLEDRTRLWFTVKARPSTDSDAQSKIQITEDGGLLRLNGAAADDSAGGAITVDDEVDGDITLTLTAETAAQLGPAESWRWDIQVAQPGPGVWTPRAGVFLVDADVTRATE